MKSKIVLPLIAASLLLLTIVIVPVQPPVDEPIFKPAGHHGGI